MSKTKSTAKRAPKNTSSKSPTNGAKVEKSRSLEHVAPADGFVRFPVDPYWWTEENELHGALFDVETTEGPDGRAVQAIVFVTEHPTRARNNWGDVLETEPGDVVRTCVPALAKLAPLAQDPENVPRAIIRAVIDRGRTRYVVDVSRETVARASLSPRAPRPKVQPS